MKKEILEGSLKYTTVNRKALEKSAKAGCYFCLKVYPARKVVTFLDSEETGLCPYCGIDSVLPDSAPYELTRATLEELHHFWF